MAGAIGWNSVELQIEALIPGILILAEAHALAPVTSAFVPASEFARAALFVAAGYSVGVVSSLVSRLIVDFVSERGPRKVVFGICAHHALDKAICDCSKNDPRFDADLQREKEKKKCEIASWNAVYRSALRRTTRRDEVDRRRSQGRFVRNLLVPVVVAPFIIFHCLWWSVLFAIASIPFLVFLYAYAEYVNFAEAYDISEAKSK